MIAVFTKYDQFLRNVAMDVEDHPSKYLGYSVLEVAERIFQEYCLQPLGNDAIYVQLKRGFRVNYCTRLHADVLWQICTGKMGNVMTLLRRQLQH